MVDIRPDTVGPRRGETRPGTARHHLMALCTTEDGGFDEISHSSSPCPLSPTEYVSAVDEEPPVSVSPAVHFPTQTTQEASTTALACPADWSRLELGTVSSPLLASCIDVIVQTTRVLVDSSVCLPEKERTVLRNHLGVLAAIYGI